MPDSTEGTGTTEGSTAKGAQGATGTGTTPPQGDALGEGGVAALKAERTARAALERELAAARKAIEDHELAGKSEAEQLRAKLATAEAESAKAAVEALRFRIAAANGIDAADAETFLTAGDEAAMTKQAERLVELRGEGKPAGAGGPKPDRSQGSRTEGDHALNGDGLLDALKAKLNIS